MMQVSTHWFHIMSGFVIQPHSSKMILDPADDHDGFMGCEEHKEEWRVRHVWEQCRGTLLWPSSVFIFHLNALFGLHYCR